MPEFVELLPICEIIHKMYMVNLFKFRVYLNYMVCGRLITPPLHFGRKGHKVVKLLDNDRKFTMPRTAGEFREFRKPYVLRRREEGRWTKYQHELSDLMYGKLLSPSEKVLLTVLYDQLFRNSNQNRTKNEEDRRTCLRVSWDALATAVGVSRNTAVKDAKHLRSLAIIGFFEVARGDVRIWLCYVGSAEARERRTKAASELNEIDATISPTGFFVANSYDEHSMRALVDDYMWADTQEEKREVLLSHGKFMSSLPPPEEQ